MIGRAVRLSGELRAIVGIFPAGFVVPFNGFQNEVVVPLQPELEAERQNHNGLRSLGLVGRLSPGVSDTQALADLNGVLAVLRRDRPDAYVRHTQHRLVPLAQQITGDVRPVIGTVWGLVASLLLLAGANLAGLLLVRGVARRREFAICAALGSSRA